MNEKIYKTMASSGVKSCTRYCRSGDGTCHRDSDDRERCETAQKKIRDFDLGKYKQKFRKAALCFVWLFGHLSRGEY